MTYSQVKTIMDELAELLQCEYAYSHFSKGSRNKYLIFYYGDDNDFHADGINYQTISNLTIEFYSSFKDIDSEQIIKNKLKSNEIGFSTSSNWIDSEKLYITTFTMEVLINEQSEI